MPKNPRLSLVIPTLGRTDELSRLLRSIQAAWHPDDVELIVADQNGDDRLVPVLAQYSGRMLHLRLGRKGLSYAKNAAFVHCRAEWVTFADDDCWYPEGFGAHLASRLSLIQRDEWLAGVAWCPPQGRALNRHGSAGWIDGTAKTRRRVFETSQISQFYRRDALAALASDQVSLFDERFGVGTYFGAAEDNDLAIRLFALGLRMKFDPTLRVFHPWVGADSMTDAKVRAYARGMGAFAKKHHWFFFFLRMVLRQALGMIQSLLSLRFGRTRYFAHGLLGRLQGFFQFQTFQMSPNALGTKSPTLASDGAVGQTIPKREKTILKQEHLNKDESRPSGLPPGQITHRT